MMFPHFPFTVCDYHNVILQYLCIPVCILCINAQNILYNSDDILVLIKLLLISE